MNARTRILTGHAVRPATTTQQPSDYADVAVAELRRELEAIYDFELDDWGYSAETIQATQRYRSRMTTFNTIYGRTMNELMSVGPGPVARSRGMLDTISTLMQSIFHRGA